jgi:hypothetical protein
LQRRLAEQNVALQPNKAGRGRIRPKVTVLSSCRVKTMSRFPALTILGPLLLAALNAQADVQVRDPIRICEGTLPIPLLGKNIAWNGACKNGRFDGQGRLKGAVESGASIIEGEFRDGRPIDASGRAMLQLADGMREMARITVVDGQAKTEPLLAIPGRTRLPITPLLGTWKWETGEGQCEESETYEAPDWAIVRSGQFRASVFVQLNSVGTNSEWMELVSINVSHNHLADCSGNSLGNVGEFDVQRTYLRFDGLGKLWRCASADEKTCSASAVRGQPPAGSERNLITSSRGINTSVPSMRDQGSGGHLLGMSADELVFNRNKGALYALYGRALRDDPKLAGKIVFEIDIAADGVATGCRIKASEIKAPELEVKLCTRIRLIRFGARDAPVTIVKAIDFFPAA